MVSRLSLLALASAVALTGAAYAADTRAVDTYIAITGTGSVSTGPADDSGLCPLDARVVSLGTGSAVVYYTYDPKGADMVRVVTTVGTDTDGASPASRFVSYLAPGQKAEVSVAGAAGTTPEVLELAYDGTSLAVRTTRERPQS
jgi:hypothetical protein